MVSLATRSTEDTPDAGRGSESARTAGAAGPGRREPLPGRAARLERDALGHVRVEGGPGRLPRREGQDGRVRAREFAAAARRGG